MSHWACLVFDNDPELQQAWTVVVRLDFFGKLYVSKSKSRTLASPWAQPWAAIAVRENCEGADDVIPYRK